MRLILSLIIGGIAGWIAGRIMDTEKGGIVEFVILGIVGSFVGSALLSLIGIYSYGIIGNMIVSVIGACILIWLVRWISSKRR